MATAVSPSRTLASPSLEDMQQQIVRLFADRRLEEAARHAREFLARAPHHSFGPKALATILGEQGQWTEALGWYERIAALYSSDSEFANNYGKALRHLGRLHDALAQFQRAINIDSRFAVAWDNLGLTLHQLDRLEDAERALQQAITLAPHVASAYEHFGNVLLLQCNIPGAEAAYRKALSLAPESHQLLNNLGSLLHGAGRHAEAEACFRQSLTLQPRYAPAWNSLGHLLASHGLHAEAELCFRAAIEHDPQHAVAHSNLLFSIAHRPEVDPADLLAEHLAFRDRFEAPLRTEWRVHSNTRDPHRALRLGFLSGDLHDHAVIRYLLPMLLHLAQYAEFTLITYSNDRIEDHVTAQLKSLFHNWRSVSLMSDVALAEQIRSDGIDILFDLSGHTGYNRLLALARKPAPIQIGWIGYVGTTGLDAMDYFIADRHFVTPELESQFTEKILHLPAGTPFQPFDRSPDVNELPAIASGVFTFGSFNRINKLSREVISTWSSILRGAPQARLLLAAMPDATPSERLLQWFREDNISPERLTFLATRGVEATLKLHHGVDLCLDPFPYGGSTTNNHALWMGVPTLTLPGRTLPSRMGTSLARHVGIPEFIAASRDEYIAKAIAHAQNPAHLGRLRGQLRHRFSESIFHRPDIIMAALVQALRAVWHRWCEDLDAKTMDFSGADTTNVETE